MACKRPLFAWQSKFFVPSTGKRKIVFRPPSGRNRKCSWESVQLPCGQCIDCKLEYSRQWAIRCYHESQLHKLNCFITLTFCGGPSPTHPVCDHVVRKDCLESLEKREFVLFMKRLRKKVGKVRFFHCGEYGENLGRPHHHACLFGYDFPDKVLRQVKNGFQLYTSEVLRELWPFGFHLIGSVSFESAAYVARYICKKITGEFAGGYYDGRIPEYVTMSRRGGIGVDWLDVYGSDVYPHGFVTLLDGVKVKAPKFYDRKYELTNPEEYEVIRRNRIERAKLSPDNTLERLREREVVQKAQLSKLKRSL